MIVTPFNIDQPHCTQLAGKCQYKACASTVCYLQALSILWEGKKMDIFIICVFFNLPWNSLCRQDHAFNIEAGSVVTWIKYWPKGSLLVPKDLCWVNDVIVQHTIISMYPELVPATISQWLSAYSIANCWMLMQLKVFLLYLI